MIKLLLFSLSLNLLAYTENDLEKMFNLTDENLKGALYGITSRHHASLGLKRAKRIIYDEVYLERRDSGYFIHDHYCDRWKFISQTRGMNIEHTWPKSRFNDKISFSQQEGDLHHLFPVDGTANSKRGSYPFAKVNGTAVYQQCSASQVGSAQRVDDIDVVTPYSFQPPRWHRGNVARAIFYFSVRYRLPIDPYEEYWLRIWNEEDPVDDLEIWRHERIKHFQGNPNPFIDFPELADQISDF